MSNSEDPRLEMRRQNLRAAERAVQGERRRVPRTKETRERELLTLDYHGKEVKRRVLEEDRAAVRFERNDAWITAVERVRARHPMEPHTEGSFEDGYQSALDALLAQVPHDGQ